jgi:hypothetical protein
VSEAQALNPALATLPTMVVVLIGILLNNARLTDVKEALRAEIKLVEANVEANMEKNHSEMLHRFGDLDTRLTRIASGLGMNRG